MSTVMACPRCGNGEFLLKPDGKIICADDDCYETYGQWAAAEADDAPSDEDRIRDAMAEAQDHPGRVVTR